jgi:hypothetical protein
MTREELIFKKSELQRQIEALKQKIRSHRHEINPAPRVYKW